MVKTKTEQAIIDALEAVAPQHDVDIVDVELVGATKAPCVRVRIEGAEGQSLSLNDVTANTKWVGDVIEELDPISSSYTLEVSSPGMARPLRRPCDFARFVGENCELTSTVTEGRRKYTGKIAAATETDVTDVSILLFFASAVLFLFGLLSEQIAALRMVHRGDD